jgi:N-acetylglucosaminyldiphosphoundecaprenol N-acetyl-beta-D-mannosaminyltransferase
MSLTASPTFVKPPSLAAIAAPPQRIGLGHLGIDSYSEAALVQDVLHHALHGQQTRQIVTANAQFYVLAEQNQAFRRCLNAADYICADGMPIVWACNRYGKTTVPRIAGVDLIEEVCRQGASDGLRVFLLGGRPNAAAKTAAILEERYKGIKIAGVSCPPFGFEKKVDTLQPVLEQIAASESHIIFVGLGAPKQELFIDDHIRKLRVPIAIGIGGSFEIIAGDISRAPLWMQSTGLEWAYRFSQEPRRLWKRYLIGNTQFLTSVVKWRYRTLRERFALQPKFRRN